MESFKNHCKTFICMYAIMYTLLYVCVCLCECYVCMSVPRQTKQFYGFGYYFFAINIY